MNGVNLLKCICDETRFEILELLERKKELCVSDFVNNMKKDQPLISHHLKTLKQCGIVKSRSEGKKMMYEISNSQLRELIVNVKQASKKIPSLCKDSCC
ncbi:MAG: metalloregulator ArsR/SmtB family transcription factor [Nitrosopumilaceae archaeon]|nr:metalloregulator ArsR/SmtB family transcription factor [Nitrosopumilaceae archaeon]